MRSDDLSLRPVEPRDLDLLARLRRDSEVAGEFSWYGYTNPAEVRVRFERDGYLGTDGGLLMVDMGDEEAAGFVSWHEVAHGPRETSRCWNIGIFLLPERRGRGAGTTAQRLVADYLFATTAVARLEAETDVDNVAEQRALEKAGFVHEGVLRRAQFRNGGWRDMAIYSRLRDE